jgi:hypothetical protein
MIAVAAALRRQGIDPFSRRGDSFAGVRYQGRKPAKNAAVIDRMGKSDL